MLAIALIVGLACLALGAMVGYESNSKTVTSRVVRTSIITQIQTTTTVEKVNVTLTPYCCIDPNVNSGTPCDQMTTQNFAIQTLEDRIEVDPSFIAGEEDNNYMSTGPPSCGTGIIPPTGTTLFFQFTYSIDRLYTDNCGDVENFTYYLDVNMPLTESGYNISTIQITPTNSSEITISCSSVLTTSENSTVTLTGTMST